ncbi:hypothetical protein AHAS_Ahas06G0076300 [Arachis hypogaea]
MQYLLHVLYINTRYIRESGSNSRSLLFLFIPKYWDSGQWGTGDIFSVSRINHRTGLRDMGQTFTEV